MPDAQANLVYWAAIAPGFVELAGAELADQCVALYRQRFAKIGLYENQLYKGVPELLSQLRDRRHDLFVASSKPRVLSSEFLSILS